MSPEAQEISRTSITEPPFSEGQLGWMGPVVVLRDVV